MAASDHLNPRFAIFRTTRIDEFENDRKSDDYAVMQDFDESLGRGTVVGEAKVSHAPASQAIRYPVSGREHEFAEKAEHSDRHYGYQTPPDAGKQGRLFRMVEHPAHHEVTDLFFAKGSQVASVPLLGVIQNRARDMTGRDAAPPYSLSAHSSRIVQHLQSSGLVGSNVKSAANNTLSWSAAQRYRDIPEGDEVTSVELSKGRATGRALARRNRPTKPQGVQERLF